LYDKGKTYLIKVFSSKFLSLLKNVKTVNFFVKFKFIEAVLILHTYSILRIIVSIAKVKKNLEESFFLFEAINGEGAGGCL